MRKASSKSGQHGPKQDHVFTSAPERAAEFLRGAHPSKTAEQVEARTGIAAATVKKWLIGHSAPSCIAMARLISAYGPEFLAHVLPELEWLSAARRATRQAELEARQAALEAEWSALDRGRA